MASPITASGLEDGRMAAAGLNNRGERVLVTGVSGFVGSAVARAFAAEGYAVRGLARASSPHENLVDFPGELITGDLADPVSLPPALDGCIGLIHVAADYRLWAKDPEEIVRNNVTSTSAIMTAAFDAGIKRIVYTSSVATIAPLPGGAAGEDRPLTEATAIGAYKRSKVAAERLVEAMVAERGLAAVIVNPSTPIGPRDVKPTPTGRIIIEAATGRMPAFVDTGLNLVHVDDVARGHLLAYQQGQIGERYILGGQDVSLGDMIGVIARAVGRKAPTITLPRAPLFPLAWAAEAVAQLIGKEPFITADALRMAKYRMYFSSAKAQRELGYSARPYETAIDDALGWFRERGMLR
jgi:hopanoid-associated sugar epimerase